MGDKIRVMIAEDHTIAREGLRALVAGEPDIDLIGEAASGAEALKQAQALGPDLVLLDLSLPQRDSLTVIRAMLAGDPKIRIIVLAAYPDDSRILPALQVGAQGYWLKGFSSGRLLQLIRELSRDETIDSTAVEACDEARELEEPVSPAAMHLTQREREVLGLLAGGQTNQQIARELSVSEHTARNHIASILAKLGLSNRTQAAIYALRHGLIPFGDQV